MSEYKLTLKSFRETVYEKEGKNVERMLEDLQSYVDATILQLTVEERRNRRRK